MVKVIFTSAFQRKRTTEARTLGSNWVSVEAYWGTIVCSESKLLIPLWRLTALKMELPVCSSSPLELCECAIMRIRIRKRSWLVGYKEKQSQFDEDRTCELP